MGTSGIKKGHRARQRGVPFCTLEGEDTTVDLTIIGGTEAARVMSYATGFAREHGGEPKTGEPLYEFGVDVMTVALGALVAVEPRPGEDPTTAPPEEVPEKRFTGPEDVLAQLDRETIALLAEHQRALQDTISPFRGVLTEVEYWEKISRLASMGDRDPDPLADCGRALRLNFERITARRLIATVLPEDSQTDKSSTSSESTTEARASS